MLFIVNPVCRRSPTQARAQRFTAALTMFLAASVTTVAHADDGTGAARIIDLSKMTDADIGVITPNHGTIRSKTLVNTRNGTVAIQAGDSPKHYHQDSDEIQYVISGTGKFWLGDTQRDIHPGDLIIIPKGTNHAGSHADSGDFKVISIKLPPQASTDLHTVK